MAILASLGTLASVSTTAGEQYSFPFCWHLSSSSMRNEPASLLTELSFGKTLTRYRHLEAMFDSNLDRREPVAGQGRKPEGGDAPSGHVRGADYYRG